ncbi:alpha/beta fold hydrolase [Kineosporia succinea]|uniref:Proline iminopeptidase n=1 Tax=Kineosporia succinea TaxID=84632 RepID=A0ABT9PE21_9ACTN|nr:alpha/beta hydrolase [Kineosporia succinea]MDP9830948.1 proline iminopeptidase [Kineosporia succinea]
MTITPHPLTPGTHSLPLGDTHVIYHVAGSGPVMIAHSGGPGVGYAYLRSTALEEHFTMIYPEPLGTGASGPLPGKATYDDTYADVLQALVDHLGIERAHLLGHSHGGVVAQRFALRFPERVAGLVLYSSTPVTDAAFWLAARDATLAYRDPSVPETADVVEAIVTDSAGLDEPGKTALLRRALPVYFADFFARQDEFEPLRRAVRSWPVTFGSTIVDYREELHRLRVPTLVVTGRHDFICGPVWAQMLHDRIPGSRLVILENSGHFASLEEPDAFVEAVLPLL